MERVSYYIFFFNDTATTEIYTLSLHDALPISRHSTAGRGRAHGGPARPRPRPGAVRARRLWAAGGPHRRRPTPWRRERGWLGSWRKSWSLTLGDAAVFVQRGCADVYCNGA